MNLNFTGFHKILKKHDRRLPNPCRTFYLGRLHNQSWVRGDYSDVIVTMSRVYSAIRGDEEIEAKESEKQDFVRSTRKYWVHTEDVSRVKYIVLQHLPVFLQKTSKIILICLIIQFTRMFISYIYIYIIYFYCYSGG